MKHVFIEPTLKNQSNDAYTNTAFTIKMVAVPTYKFTHNPRVTEVIALIVVNHLEFSIEAEKDNGLRFSSITPNVLLKALDMINKPLDVVAQSGWTKGLNSEGDAIGAGYSGLKNIILKKRAMLGQEVTYFSSSHERSHLLCDYGLSPFPQGQPCYALLWEGHVGAFSVTLL